MYDVFVKRFQTASKQIQQCYDQLESGRGREDADKDYSGPGWSRLSIPLILAVTLAVSTSFKMAREI